MAAQKSIRPVRGLNPRVAPKKKLKKKPQELEFFNRPHEVKFILWTTGKTLVFKIQGDLNRTYAEYTKIFDKLQHRAVLEFGDGW